MSYDDIHRDEAPQLRQQLEQGELIEDEGSVTEDLPPNTDMAKTIQLLQKQQLEMSAKMTQLVNDSHEDDLHDWKEGLRKQYAIMDKIDIKLTLIDAAADLRDCRRVKDINAGAKSLVAERKKELKIADTSDGGWETVNLYKSNPVADRRIRRADKMAKERIATKQRRGRGGYRGHFNQRRQNNWEPRDSRDDYRDYPYRSTGSSRSRDPQQRNTYVPDSRRRQSQSSSVCYLCEQQGHWQDACPSKQYARRDRH